MTTLAAGSALRIQATAAGAGAIAIAIAIGQRVLLELRAVPSMVLATVAVRRRRRQALDTFDRLDARTLKDIGIDRGRVTLSL